MFIELNEKVLLWVLTTYAFSSSVVHDLLALFILDNGIWIVSHGQIVNTQMIIA